LKGGRDREGGRDRAAHRLGGGGERERTLPYAYMLKTALSVPLKKTKTYLSVDFTVNPMPLGTDAC
jgi:hypothetical protein